ncbi:unnamed protein product [Notodromas monacha]|uniref:C2H2-type domain-containing protein n=1 Tax=Notodromas monacha TaxID=399045 RepID=A0A7R9G9X6_9CRUS|nr:unnamed protein product [Notodromas monacha]CAG0913533.1 unnamed protein product [Notodromas monacha]
MVRCEGGSGRLEAAAEKGTQWTQHLLLAKDCHSKNVLVSGLVVATGCQSREDPVIVTGTVCSADLRPGAQVLAWFSDEICAQIGMPFLGLSHIKGAQVLAWFSDEICAQIGMPFLGLSHIKGASPMPGLGFPAAAAAAAAAVGQLCGFPALFPPGIPFPAHASALLGLGRFPALYPGLPASPAFHRPPQTPVEMSLPTIMPGPGTSSVLQPSPPQPSTPGAHMSNADLETMVSNIGRGKGGHLCLYCGKIYSRKYGLKIHIRTHTGYKPLRCKVCLRPFGDPSNLNKHIRLHAQGDTPYRCDLCGKILVRRRDLERHLLSRHPDQAPTSSGLSAENARRQEPDTSGCQSRDADDDQDLDVGTERRPMTSTSSFRVMDLSSSQRRRTSDSSDDFAPSSSTATCEDIDVIDDADNAGSFPESTLMI